MAEPWKQLSKRYVFELKPHLKVRRDMVIRSDGKKVKYALLEYPDTAVIVAVDGEKKICLVRLWRYPLGLEQLELPMGSANSGEAVKTAAIRELKEETGIKVKKVTEIGMFYPSPGKSGGKAYVFVASDIDESEGEFDKTEITAVEKYSFDEIAKMIKAGTIKDAFTIVAMWYYEKALKTGRT